MLLLVRNAPETHCTKKKSTNEESVDVRTNLRRSAVEDELASLSSRRSNVVRQKGSEGEKLKT